MIRSIICQHIMEDMQFRKLLEIDNLFEETYDVTLPVIPEFHILGETALLFYGLCGTVASDIDIANEISEEVASIVGANVRDDAVRDAVIPTGYIDRIKPFRPESFKNIAVFLLSPEDIVVTKLVAWRPKDISDLSKSNIISICSKGLIETIIDEELDPEKAGLLRRRLNSIPTSRSLFSFN